MSDTNGSAAVSPTVSAAGYFEDLSDEYGSRYAQGGLWHRHFFGGRRRIAEDLLADLLVDVRGALVVDVGSGPAPLAAALTARGCRVVALDRSPGMLRHARRAGALPLRSDALALPLTDGCADAAMALGLSPYVPSLAELLTELHRILKPGGHAVVSVATSTCPDWWARRALRAPAAALGFRGVLTSGIDLRTYSAGEWRRAARDAGFEIDVEKGHDFTLFPLSRVLPGPAVAISSALEALDARSLDRLSSEVVLLLRKGGAPRPPRARTRPLRLVRVIARLNIGGPATHTVLATAGLRPGVTTVLATGHVDTGEEEASDLLGRYSVTPERVPGLGRAVSPLEDLRALAVLLSIVRRERPDIVHTHTAKAGALGRAAALLGGVPHVVHTFHGHVFSGYFGSLGSAAVVMVERLLARLSDRLVAVSTEVASDLTDRYRVARRGSVDVVPIGLPLEPFLESARHRGELRAELDLPADAPIVVFLGRLVPVKEPEVALAAWELVRREIPDARLVVVGAGPLYEPLRARGDAGVHFVGWRRDAHRILADAALVLLTSRNEGTPVALVEAAAAGLPVVATEVGGVASVVLDAETGLLAPRGDAAAIAAAVVELLRDPERREVMGAAARERATRLWSGERLLRDLRRLYEQLVSPNSSGSA